jgi:hypothetical protein
MSDIHKIRAALIHVIYEVTHLSPMEDDGSHKTRISKACLTRCREALALLDRQRPLDDPELTSLLAEAESYGEVPRG